MKAVSIVLIINEILCREKFAEILSIAIFISICELYLYLFQKQIFLLVIVQCSDIHAILHIVLRNKVSGFELGDGTSMLH